MENVKFIGHFETKGAHFLPKTIEIQKRFDEVEKELNDFRKIMGNDSIYVKRLEKSLEEAKQKQIEMENKVFYQNK